MLDGKVLSRDTVTKCRKNHSSAVLDRKAARKAGREGHTGLFLGVHGQQAPLHAKSVSFAYILVQSSPFRPNKSPMPFKLSIVFEGFQGSFIRPGYQAATIGKQGRGHPCMKPLW